MCKTTAQDSTSRTGGVVLRGIQVDLAGLAGGWDNKGALGGGWGGGVEIFHDGVKTT